MGKGENAGYQHFLLFPQCFQKLSFREVLKVGISRVTHDKVFDLTILKAYAGNSIQCSWYDSFFTWQCTKHWRKRSKCWLLDLDIWQWLWQMTLTLIPKKRPYHKKYTYEIWKFSLANLKVMANVKIFDRRTDYMPPFFWRSGMKKQEGQDGHGFLTWIFERTISNWLIKILRTILEESTKEHPVKWFQILTSVSRGEDF